MRHSDYWSRCFQTSRRTKTAFEPCVIARDSIEWHWLSLHINKINGDSGNYSRQSSIMLLFKRSNLQPTVDNQYTFGFSLIWCSISCIFLYYFVATTVCKGYKIEDWPRVYINCKHFSPEYCHRRFNIAFWLAIRLEQIHPGYSSCIFFLQEICRQITHCIVSRLHNKLRTHSKEIGPIMSGQAANGVNANRLWRGD